MVEKMPRITEERAKPDKVAINVRNIDRDLRDRFKILCVQYRMPMQEALATMIEDAVVRGRL